MVVKASPTVVLKHEKSFLRNLKWRNLLAALTAEKMKFSIKDFFSKCDQIHRKLWIWSHLLKNL